MESLNAMGDTLRFGGELSHAGDCYTKPSRSRLRLAISTKRLAHVRVLVMKLTGARIGVGRSRFMSTSASLKPKDLEATGRQLEMSLEMLSRGFDG